MGVLFTIWKKKFFNFRDINEGIEHIPEFKELIWKKGVINYIKYQAFSNNKNSNIYVIVNKYSWYNNLLELIEIFE